MKLIAFLALVSCLTQPLLAQNTPEIKASAQSLGIPYTRYSTPDTLGRSITFYLSAPPAASSEKPWPLILFIDGSGCQSLFQKVGERVGGGMQNLLLLVAKGKAHVMAVEKPGVQYLDNPSRPGSAEGASAEFLSEHTLDRWAEANRAALAAARSLPNVDPSKLLVIGHSEGGLVAARVSNLMPEVTHVASLAGGGPVQLFSLAEQRAMPQPNDTPASAQQRRESLFNEWSQVLRDPDSTTKMWLGHPHRRWSTFMATSVIDELKKSKANIFLAQGGRDEAVPPTGHDVLVAELKFSGRPVTELRLPEADHGFRKSTDPIGSPDGLKMVLNSAVEWFVATKQ